MEENMEKNATHITFGYGNVRMSKARKENESFESILVLSDFPEGKPVGSLDENCPYRNRPASEIPGPRVELWFDNLAGIDALIKSLSEVRDDMSKSLTPNPRIE